MSSASDLLLHLRPCKIQVTFEDRTYTIPAMDAVDWIVYLDGDHPDLYEIFPVLAGQDAIEHVEDALWEERVTLDDVAQVALEAVGVAADRKWWVVIKMIGSAKHRWDVVHVNRAAGMSLAGWLDELWSKIIAHIDPKKRQAWINDIQAPPKGVREEVDFDAEEAAFLNAMKAVAR